MKKKIIALLMVCLCLSLVGCGPEYEDTNGAEDFTLQTITDENIIHLETGSSGLTIRQQKLAGFILNTDYSAKNHNGVDQIYLTSFVRPSDIDIYVGHMNVEGGNFKLVAINNDEIIHEFALDSFGDTISFKDLTGDFSIHIAGESAKFEFHIEVQ